MRAHIKLGRIFGIAIGLHYSWIIIALLVTLSLRSQFAAVHPDWSNTTTWTTAIITGLLFFVSILLHELSHAAVAKLRGLPVRAITLFALGGVAQIEKDAADAKTEFWMGIMGPVASVLIGVICLVLAYILGWNLADEPNGPIAAMFMWLGVINIALAIFNMIPGFPLDGGRVLRAIVWWITGDANRSTRIASVVGQFVAFGFIMIGILRFFGGAGFGGLWLAFIGWFLLDAARASGAQVEIAERLNGVSVGDVMTRQFPVVDGNSNLETFVHDHLLPSGHRCFVVLEQGRPAGIITPHEVKTIARARWPYTTVSDVMRSLESLSTVGPERPVTEALELMGREDVNQVPVVQGGALAGIISRGHITRLLQTRAELDV
ncbi:MAG TPA: site-2 protease family protein [Pyrinomonadaceae bacterium]|jgi:Zn-dependent protease/predicted transcriptional regulator|nr:site-2 protease family protein [Pyrinomonadaceae bacterium]